VDQAGILVYTDMHLHTEIPLVGLLCMLHLWNPFAGFTFGETGSRDLGGIIDYALLYGHSSLFEVSLNCLKNLMDVLASQAEAGT